ncbi:MAG: fimbria/pilus periplasmic chaperone [Alcanivorax sp.]|uniref:fimbrial biogenesis chaperone n=1 Tax=Alcanivorax sp. TaxID=1872427 RepID=UPI0032D9A287
MCIMIKRFAVLFVPVLLTLAPSLMAGQLTVAPIRLTMSPTQPNATFTLTNGSNKDGFYQLQLFAWEQKGGETQLKRQQDLVITPPVTMIPGNSDQVVRVVRQRPTVSDKEKSYRLIISEVPDTESERGAQLKVLLRLSVPVFVGDKNQTHALTVTRQQDRLVIRNSGNGHARLVNAYWLDDKQQPRLIRKGLAGYVLPDSDLGFDHDPRDGQPTAISVIANGKKLILPVEEE